MCLTLHLLFQVLTNHLEDKMLDNTEGSQASIYRNLWIEAEASACKLKYELQHARLKLETAKGLNDTVKGTPSLHKCKHFQDFWDICRRKGNECDVHQSITKITETQLTPSFRTDAINAKC